MDTRNSLGCACLILLSSSVISGQESGPADAPARRIEVTAAVRMELAAWLRRGTSQKVEVTFAPELKLLLPFHLKLTALGRVRADLFDALEPGKPSQLELSRATRTVMVGDRVELELREFRLQRTLGPALVTLGKQQVVWGRADGLKVLDIVNTQDFREFILDDFGESRIPLWMANIEWTVRDLDVQLLWVPDRSAHRLPPPNAPFAFTAPSVRPGPPPPFVHARVEIDRPNRALADADAGVRVARAWKG